MEQIPGHGHDIIELEEPFDPNQAQVEVDIIFAEALNSTQVSRCLFEVEETIEILFYHDITEIYGY